MKTFEKVLIVKDDESTIFIYTYLLKEIGVAKEILAAYNGKQALEILKHYFLSDNKAEKDSLGLVFLHQYLPILDGFEILEELHKLGLSSLIEERIIVFTKYTSVEDNPKLAKYGVKKFMTKPLTEEKLLPFLITE